jgi:hypothetical protein
MTIQTSLILCSIKHIVSTRTEENSIAAVISDIPQGPTLLADTLLLNLSPIVKLPPPLTLSLVHLPTRHPNNLFFNLVQTPRVPRSAPYAWDKTSAKSADVVLKISRMDPRPDAGRTTKDNSLP